MMSKSDWVEFFDKLEEDYPGPELAQQREQMTQRRMVEDAIKGGIESGRINREWVIAQIDERLRRGEGGVTIIG